MGFDGSVWISQGRVVPGPALNSPSGLESRRGQIGEVDVAHAIVELEELVMHNTPPPMLLSAALRLPYTPGRSAKVFID